MMVEYCDIVVCWAKLWLCKGKVILLIQTRSIDIYPFDCTYLELVISPKENLPKEITAALWYIIWDTST